MVISFFGIIVCSTIFFIGASLKRAKNLFTAENKKFASTMATKKFKDVEENSVNQSIDLNDSLSVTQYGNDVLKNISSLSNFMYDLTQNSLLDRTSRVLEDIVANKSRKFTSDEFLEHNFVAHYTKDRLVKQVILIQQNIPRYEYAFKDFDRIIQNAEKVVASFKPTTSSDAYEIEQLNTKKSNVELLKNKIINLKKSKIYHQQSIAQLKVMLALNNRLMVEFDNIIHHMLPLIKNNVTIDSVKSFNVAELSNYIDQIRKINTIKS